MKPYLGPKYLSIRVEDGYNSLQFLIGEQKPSSEVNKVSKLLPSDDSGILANVFVNLIHNLRKVNKRPQRFR